MHKQRSDLVLAWFAPHRPSPTSRARLEPRWWTAGHLGPSKSCRITERCFTAGYRPMPSSCPGAPAPSGGSCGDLLNSYVLDTRLIGVGP
jgi:hypothetical protein